MDRLSAAIVVAVLAIVLTAGANLATWIAGSRADERLDEDVHALCDAAGGARDFWIKVRAATVLADADPHLSPTGHESNRAYIVALNEVIKAADGIAHGCEGGS